MEWAEPGANGMKEVRDLPSYLRRGFFNKYRVEKANGNAVDPNARYFILRYDEDPHAVVAMIAYAKSIVGKNSDFAQDLLVVVHMHAKKHGKLYQWSDAASELLRHCKAPAEEAELVRRAKEITENQRS